MEKYDVIFESERINFIKLNEDLVNDYLIMVNDEEVQKCISHEKRHYTYESEIEWVKSKLDNNDVAFSMIDKITGEYIGNIEIRSIKDGVGELAIAITPKKQNMHYGRESIEAILKYSYEVLKLKSVFLKVFDHNLKAINCYKNTGFVEDGQIEDEIHMTHVR